MNNINKILEKFEELQENMLPARSCSVPVTRIDDQKGGYEVFLCAYRINANEQDGQALKLVKESSFSYEGWHNYDEVPKGNFPDGYSFDVLIDLNGKRKDFRVGWYDFDNKEWMFHVMDTSSIVLQHLSWTKLPLE